MSKYFAFLACAAFLFFSFPATAQQSSKSKSKARFREKDSPENKVVVRNAATVNSTGTDYSPTFYQNGIVYVSSRQKTGAQDQKTGETFSELYFAPLDENKEPARPQKFSIEINSKLHEGPVTFSKDARTMFFTQNNMKKGVQKSDQQGKVRLKIYEAQRGPIDWYNRQELPFNSDEYSCLHPALSADEQHLYFASDMPGGQGGFDIWVSTRMPNGVWGAPQNLGPTVNSEKSELYPFVHVDGTLFFASNGHNTLGGLDIFYLVEDQGQQELVNMGEPFNSAFDDLAFIIDEDLKRGFFTSNRERNENGGPYSKGKDDIFLFTMEKSVEGAARPQLRRARIVVSDARTGQTLQGAEIRILKSSSDGFVDNAEQFYGLELQPVEGSANTVSLRLERKQNQQMPRPDLLTNSNGEALTDFSRYRSYVVMVSMPGFQTVERFYTTGDQPGDDVLHIALADAPLCHRATGTIATDQFGTRIANATMRFTHKLTGREITVRTDLNGQYDVCLPQSGDYLVQIERKGFLPDNFSLVADLNRATYDERRLRPVLIGGQNDPGMMSESDQAKAVAIGSVIVMDRILYEGNQTTLNASAIRNLDALYDLMNRYPTMEIELVAHTQTSGDARINQSVSDERADNAKSYLEYRGIAAARIKASGKGASTPRNRCKPGVTCTEEEHKSNQRIEVVVTRI